MFRNSMLIRLLGFCFSVVTPGVGVTSVQPNDLIPAGTIIYCILDEPSFSSKTAMVGDPILCNLAPLRSFGHLVFPRGAQLNGHLQAYKNPGHFVGKGSLSIEFDRLVLSNSEVLPLSAKIISATHQTVDAQGVIRGKGHPERDAALWAIPVFWPIKICTLPARGPFPSLKGESRIGLRLMEDVELPLPTVTQNSVPRPPWVRPSNSSSRADSRPMATPNSKLVNGVPSSPATDRDTLQITVIALQGGAAVLAREYWLDGATLHCVLQDGAEKDVPIATLDFEQTLKLNQARNVTLSLHSKDMMEQ